MVARRYRLGFALSILVVSASVPQARVPAQAAQVPVPKAAPKAPAQKASPADEALPTARSIIDRHILAIGGRAAILARSSSHAVGTVSIPSAGMTGSVDLFTAKPDKITPADHTRRDRIDRGRLRRQGRLVAVAADRPDAGAGEGAGAEALRLRFPRRSPQRRSIRIDDDDGEDGVRGTFVLQAAARALAPEVRSSSSTTSRPVSRRVGSRRERARWDRSRGP